MVEREEEALSGRPKTRSYWVQRDRGDVISVEIGDVLFFFLLFSFSLKGGVFRWLKLKSPCGGQGSQGERRG